MNFIHCVCLVGICCDGGFLVSLAYPACRLHTDSLKLATVGVSKYYKSGRFCVLESCFSTFTSTTSSTLELHQNFCDWAWNFVLLKSFPEDAGVASQAESEEWIWKMLTVHSSGAGISANRCSVGAWMLPKIGNSLLQSNRWKTLSSPFTHGVLESSRWHLCSIPPQTESSLSLSKSCAGIAQALPVIQYSEQGAVPLQVHPSILIVQIPWCINAGLICPQKRALWILGDTSSPTAFPHMHFFFSKPHIPAAPSPSAMYC